MAIPQETTSKPDQNSKLDYRHRIKTEDKAQAYRKRRPSRHRQEMYLVARALRHLPSGGTVLDAPCGNGRLVVLLARAGFKVTGADMSHSTLAVAKVELAARSLHADLEKRDLENLDYPDQHFDATICFRFFHHLPTDEARRRVIKEICRVTRETVLISYLNPWSPTMLKRRVRSALGGKKSLQHATPLSVMKNYMNEHGFVFREDLAQRRFIRSLHLACFDRSNVDYQQ